MDEPTVGRPRPAEPQPPSPPTTTPPSRRAAQRLNLRDVGLGALLGCAALFVYLVYMSSHAHELTDPNSMDYAQIARHLQRGEGFTTSFLRPLSLAQVQNISHHPELSFMPLHPLWMSLFFRLGGPTYKMAAWSCGVAYLLTLPLVYLLAARLFDRRCGLIALAVYAVNYLSLQYAVSGLEVSLATLVVTVLVLLLYSYLTAPAPSLALAILCGVVAALACLVKEVLVVLFVPVLVVVLLRRGQRRWTEALVCLAAFVLAMAPWAVRNAQITGNPFFSLRSAEMAGGTITYKGQSLYRRYLAPPPAALPFLLTHPREAWLKVRPVLLSMYDAIPNLGGPFIAAFFIAGVFIRFKQEAAHVLRRWGYAAILLVALTLCLLSADARLLLPLAPLAVVLGIGGALALLDRLAESTPGLRQRRRLIGWGTGGLIAVCWLPVALMTLSGQPPDEAATADVKRICATLTERKAQPIYTDQPWALAWYGDLNAIWLPQGEDDLKALEDQVGPVQYALLSPALPQVAEDEALGTWGRFYNAGRRGMTLPFHRFVPADALGAGRDWLLYGRIPESTQAEESAAAASPGP